MMSFGPANRRILAVLILAASAPSVTLAAADQRRATVGMPARVEQIVLPGPPLEARPLRDDRTPVVVRIAAEFPHGTARRYDLVYYGLEPGRFDLRDFLRRRDGTSLEDLPPIWVEIDAVLPPGTVRPNELRANSPPSLGGYGTTLLIAALVWGVGLLAILWWNWAGRRVGEGAANSAAAPVSLAARLRPVVEDAMAGNTNSRDLAELERMLLSFWRRRLGLDDLPAAEAVAALRDHDEAGALLRQLEQWLHAPGQAANVDVAALLRPYHQLPADAMEVNR